MRLPGSRRAVESPRQRDKTVGHCKLRAVPNSALGPFAALKRSSTKAPPLSPSRLPSLAPRSAQHYPIKSWKASTQHRFLLLRELLLHLTDDRRADLTLYKEKLKLSMPACEVTIAGWREHRTPRNRSNSTADLEKRPRPPWHLGISALALTPRLHALSDKPTDV